MAFTADMYLQKTNIYLLHLIVLHMGGGHNKDSEKKQKYVWGSLKVECSKVSVQSYSATDWTQSQTSSQIISRNRVLWFLRV